MRRWPSVLGTDGCFTQLPSPVVDGTTRVVLFGAPFPGSGGGPPVPGPIISDNSQSATIRQLALSLLFPRAVTVAAHQHLAASVLRRHRVFLRTWTSGTSVCICDREFDVLGRSCRP